MHVYCPNFVPIVITIPIDDPISGPITVQMDACVKSMQKIVCLFLGSSAFDGYWPLLLYLLCQSQVCCLDNQPVAIATAKMHQYNHHFYNNNNSFQDCYDIIYCILTLHYIRYILQLFFINQNKIVKPIQGL